MDVVYSTNWIARTRRRAAWLLVWYALILVPVTIASVQREPAEWFPRAALALTPVLIARLCWRFLADAEASHPEPTPEMEFIFRLMTTVLIALGGVVAVALSTI